MAVDHRPPGRRTPGDPLSRDACAKFILLAKQLLPGTTRLNVSFVGSQALTQALGDQGDDVIVTQVVPHYGASRPGVAEYRQPLPRYSEAATPDFASLEAYLVAQTFVEGVRRVPGDRDPRAHHRRAGEHWPPDIGIPLHFSCDQHRDSHHVWLAVIRKQTLVPFEW